MGYPEPTPEVRGKRARGIQEDLGRKHITKATSRWRGSKESYEFLSKR